MLSKIIKLLKVRKISYILVNGMDCGTSPGDSLVPRSWLMGSVWL